MRKGNPLRDGEKKGRENFGDGESSHDLQEKARDRYVMRERGAGEFSTCIDGRCAPLIEGGEEKNAQGFVCL